MLQTSAAYKSAIKAPSRRSTGVVVIDFANQWELPFASVIASTTAAGYSADEACNGRIRVSDIAGSGVYTPPPLLTTSKGWEGTVISDATGLLATPETLTITYNEEALTGNFWVIGNETNYPVDFRIEVFDTAWREIQNVVAHDSHIYSYAIGIPTAFTKARITITRISKANSAAFVLECGAVTTIVLDEEDLVDISLMEETGAESGNPIALVSANGCTIGLRNDHGYYIPQNNQSPYAGMLQPGTRFRTYMGIEVSTDIFEFIPLGVFYSTEWDTAEQQMTAYINGHDILYDMGDLPIPILPLETNISAKDLFERLFIGMGLTSSEYSIDASLADQIIPYGWIPNGKVKEALQDLSVATRAVVFVNRLEVLSVKVQNLSTQEVDTWTDDDLIIDASNPQKFNQVFSKVVIKQYNGKASAEIKELGGIRDIKLDAGSTQIIKVNFKDGPITKVSSIQLLNANTSYVAGVEIGAFTAEIVLTNPGTQAETGLDLTLQGYPLELTSGDYEISDPQTTLKFETVTSIDCVLLQDGVQVKEYGSDLIKIVSDPKRYVTLETRGDPSVELQDIIQIDAPSRELENVVIYPTRISIDYDGGLSSRVEAFKQNIPYDWVYVSPGLYIYAERTVT